MSDKNAVSREYGISILYVSWPKNNTPSSISSQITNRRISPKYRPEISFLSKFALVLATDWLLKPS